MVSEWRSLKFSVNSLKADSLWIIAGMSINEADAVIVGNEFSQFGS